MKLIKTRVRTATTAPGQATRSVVSIEGNGGHASDVKPLLLRTRTPLVLLLFCIAHRAAFCLSVFQIPTSQHARNGAESEFTLERSHVHVSAPLEIGSRANWGQTIIDSIELV